MSNKYHRLKSAFIIILTSNLSTSTIIARSPGFQDTFKQCLVSYQPHSDIKTCLGLGAISRLQSLDANPEFDFVDGLTLSRDATQEYRDNDYNYADQNPSDLRSIVDTFDHVFSKRAMRWDMSFIYPGLNMRVAPSFSPDGILEFVMDQNREAASVHRLQEVGTGRLLAKQFLVPLLLGFKFNVATLLPIMFGILVIIAKKAVFLSKLALILSSAFGLGSLLFNNGGHQHHDQHHDQHHTDHNHHGAQYYHPTTYGSYYNKEYSNAFAPQPDLQYRGLGEAANDPLKMYGSLPDAYGQRSVDDVQNKNSRNFAWNDDEKKKKLNSS